MRNSDRHSYGCKQNQNKWIAELAYKNARPRITRSYAYGVWSVGRKAVLRFYLCNTLLFIALKVCQYIARIHVPEAWFGRGNRFHLCIICFHFRACDTRYVPAILCF